MYDAIIIGAGPAGLYCARLLKEYGIKFMVIEEHKEIGLPVQCSGLISWNLEEFCGWDRICIENIVHEAMIHSPNGLAIRLRKSKPVYVIDRHLFDKSLSIGLENFISFGTKALSIGFDKEYAVIHTDKGEFQSKIIIGADGPNSVAGRHFGVLPESAIGVMAFEDKKTDINSVELYYDRKITENFLWKIPRKSRIEYGMMGKNAKISQLKAFFGIGDAEFSGGLVPIKPAKKTYFNRCILLGDAAGQVKPWSGGGVIYSLTCAKIAAGVIKKCLENNDFSENALSEYEKQWKKAIGKQIMLGRAWNSFLEKSNNSFIDAFFLFSRIIPWKLLDMDFLAQCAVRKYVFCHPI